MTTTFINSFGLDYAILDKFNLLCNYELIKTNERYNIYDKQLDEYVFDEDDLSAMDLLDIWTEKAYTYYATEYIDNIGTLADSEDYARQKLYLHELEFIKGV